MKIGILSDSHGRGAITAVAAQRLAAAGAELLIHLGDVCGESVLDAMVCGLDAEGKPKPPVRVVFGNCDHDAASLGRYAAELGIAVDHPVGRLDAGAKRVVFMHGHMEGLMREAVEAGAHYLLHGHTHRLRDERVGGTRIINPGALCRASVYTVALLDTRRDVLEVLEVGEIRR